MLKKCQEEIKSFEKFYREGNEMLSCLTVHCFSFKFSRSSVICGTYSGLIDSVKEKVGLNFFFWIYHLYDSKGK